MQPYKFPTCLDFALFVINDETAPFADRVRLAMAFAPYQHGKIADIPSGKKAVEKARAAIVASPASGDEPKDSWGSDLEFGKAN